MWPFKKTTDEEKQTTFLDLRSQLDELELRQLRIEEQFRSLRGYVYAKKGLVGAPGTAPPGDVVAPAVTKPPATNAAPESRDELRRRLVTSGRFIPGKPPQHGE